MVLGFSPVVLQILLRRRWFLLTCTGGFVPDKESKVKREIRKVGGGGGNLVCSFVP